MDHLPANNQLTTITKHSVHYDPLEQNCRFAVTWQTSRPAPKSTRSRLDEMQTQATAPSICQRFFSHYGLLNQQHSS